MGYIKSLSNSSPPSFTRTSMVLVFSSLAAPAEKIVAVVEFPWAGVVRACSWNVPFFASIMTYSPSPLNV